MKAGKEPTARWGRPGLCKKELIVERIDVVLLCHVQQETCVRVNLAIDSTYDNTVPFKEGVGLHGGE